VESSALNRECPMGVRLSMTTPRATSKGGLMSSYKLLLMFFLSAGLLTCMIVVGLLSLHQ